MPNNFKMGNTGRNTFLLLFAGLSLVVMPAIGVSAEANGVQAIDKMFLSKHLPMLKNPRVMTLGDVREKQETNILHEKIARYKRCSFILKGDFNKDGRGDYAVIGKYDGPFPGKSLFIAIFSGPYNKPTLDYLHRLPYPHDRGFLCLTTGEQMHVPRVTRKYDIILVILAVDSDNFYALVWDGKKYIQTDEARWVNTE
jgi:hypothetical protein